MLKNLVILSKRFGIASGFLTYCSLKFNKSGRIAIPNLKYPICFRSKTIDEFTIIEIFGLNCYDIDLPFTPKYIIDGGANIGLSSVYFANKYPKCKIIAVEPEIENYSLLVKNIENYGNVSALHSAIWKNNDLLEVKDKGYGLRGFMVEENVQESETSIKAVSINEINSDNQIIDILKLDIEGSEKFVFEQNYQKWLPNTRCIIIELHDEMVENCSKIVQETIAKYNFKQYEKDENIIFINMDLTINKQVFKKDVLF